MMGFLTVVGLVASVISIGGGIYEAVSSGAWKNWGILEWVANIGMMCFILTPFYKAFKGASLAKAAATGGLMKTLERVPVLGPLASKLASHVATFRKYCKLSFPVLFAKGGWLDRFGHSFSKLADMVRKHPYLAAGMLFASSMFDGILQRIFQMWGDLSLKAANFAYERMSQIMAEGGYGDPVGEAVSIMNEASNSLPECFTAIWGAVGASECIGLVITTFQYIILLAALTKGFKVAGVKK